MKRYLFTALILVMASSFTQAAITPITPITQNFNGLIEQLDLNGDDADDLSVGLQSFDIAHSGEVSIAGSAVGIQWFLMVFDEQGDVIPGQPYYAHFGAPTVNLMLDAGTYQFAIGGFLFNEADAAQGYTSNKTLADVGFTGATNNVGWNVTVISPGMEVPLPAALPLFISSLVALVAIGRRRKA